MVTLTQLRYILAVHRHGHFGAAAKACGVSQPTISAQVKRAEQELGATLFVRQSRPVRATEKGLRLMEEAERVLGAHARMMQQTVGHMGTLAGRLSLGIIPTLAPYVTHLFAGPFAQKYPEIELTIVERPTEEMVLDLRRLRLDVGLLATPLEMPRLRERVLFYDPFYLYASQGHPILEQAEIEPSSLDPDELRVLADGHCLRNQTLTLCDLGEGGSCFHGTVRFEAGSLETLQRLIDASQGYTLVPETFARLLPRNRRLSQIRPFQEPSPAREVSLIHLEHSWKSDIIDALEQTISASLPRFLRRERSTLTRVPVPM